MRAAIGPLVCATGLTLTLWIGNALKPTQHVRAKTEVSTESFTLFQTDVGQQTDSVPQSINGSDSFDTVVTTTRHDVDSLEYRESIADMLELNSEELQQQMPRIVSTRHPAGTEEGASGSGDRVQFVAKRAIRGASLSQLGLEEKSPTLNLPFDLPMPIPGNRDVALTASPRLAGKLERIMSIDMDEQPINDVLRQLATQYDLQILIDDAVIQSGTIAGNPPVTFHVNGIRLKNVLLLMLDTLKLTFVADGDAIRIIPQSP